MGANDSGHTHEIDREIAEFLIDRQSRNLAAKTLRWYGEGLQKWRAYIVERGVTATAEVKPHHVRRFLVDLQDAGHVPGGVAGIYSTVRMFITWYGKEFAPDGWRNPLQNIAAPKRTQEQKSPIAIADFKKMLATVKPKTFAGARDRAILLTLLDTGMRLQEMTDLNVGDVSGGQVAIRSGKGRKTRIVFIGATTKRALAAWLQHHPDPSEDAPMWARDDGERLSRDGVRQVIRRMADKAGIKEPGLHDFRRAFAVNFLNNGGDVLSFQRLMGHSNTSVTSRYVKMAAADLKRTHAKASPVDNM